MKTAHDAVSEGARDVGAVSEEVGCVNCNSVCVLHLVLVVAHGRTIRGGSKPSARHTAWDIFPTAHQPDDRAGGHGGHGLFRDSEQAHGGRVRRLDAKHAVTAGSHGDIYGREIRRPISAAPETCWKPHQNRYHPPARPENCRTVPARRVVTAARNGPRGEIAQIIPVVLGVAE